MPKEEWGVKRACPKCATRFYDLQNDPMTCPSCEATFDLASLTQTKSRTALNPKVVKPVAPAAEEADDAEEVVLVDDDDTAASADETGADVNLGDDLLDDDEDEDDTVGLEEIADLPVEDDD